LLSSSTKRVDEKTLPKVEAIPQAAGQFDGDPFAVEDPFDLSGTATTLPEIQDLESTVAATTITITASSSPTSSPTPIFSNTTSPKHTPDIFIPDRVDTPTTTTQKPLSTPSKSYLDNLYFYWGLGFFRLWNFCGDKEVF
jgi:hypothetical protein